MFFSFILSFQTHSSVTVKKEFSECAEAEIVSSTYRVDIPDIISNGQVSLSTEEFFLMIFWRPSSQSELTPKNNAKINGFVQIVSLIPFPIYKMVYRVRVEKSY